MNYLISLSFWAIISPFVLYCFVCRLQEGLKDQTETLARRCDDIIWKHYEYLCQKPNTTKMHKWTELYIVYIFFFLPLCREKQADQGCQERKETLVLRYVTSVITVLQHKQHRTKHSSHPFRFIMQASCRCHSDDLIYLFLCYRAALEILVLLVTVEWR